MSTHHIDRNAGYTGLAARPTRRFGGAEYLDSDVDITNF